MFEFIWKGKSHKIKQNVAIQDFKYGGVKMVDIFSTMMCERLKWVKEYLNNTNGIWRYTMEEAVGVKNLNMLLRGNYDVKLLFKCTPFYAETLQYWHDAKYFPVTADTDGSNQQLLIINVSASMVKCFIIKPYLRLEFGTLKICLILEIILLKGKIITV